MCKQGCLRRMLRGAPLSVVDGSATKHSPVMLSDVATDSQLRRSRSMSCADHPSTPSTGKNRVSRSLRMTLQRSAPERSRRVSDEAHPVMLSDVANDSQLGRSRNDKRYRNYHR